VTLTCTQAVAREPRGDWAIVVREPNRWVIDVVGPLGPMLASLSGLPVADLHVDPFALEKTVLELMDGGTS
jgi:hypothetical protein